MQNEFTAKELATILGVTVQAVRDRAMRGGWRARETSGRGRGGKTLHYPLSALPADVQAAVALRESQALAESKARASQAAPILPDATIPDWSHQIGLDRYRLAHEFRAARALSPRGGQRQAAQAFLTAYNAGQLLEQVFARLGGVSEASLYAWDKKLREAGDDYRALCDRRGRWTKGGAKGLGQIGREAETVFLACWLTPNRPSVSLAARAATAALEKRGLPVPSERSFARFAERFDAERHDLVVLKREGEKGLKDKVGPFITRDDKILAVGDVIFCDGHVCNFEAIHPFTGKACRPTLITWFDWRSRMPVGWEIQPSEDTLGISSALRMAILNLGKAPRVAYLDNGRAFKARYFTADADLGELAGLYARLGIALQFSKPYEARTKIVERFFGTFTEQCARILPSFTGADIADKPAWRARNEAYHKRRHNPHVPTFRDVGEIFAAYVRWYSQQLHEGLGGRPWDVLQGGQGPGVDPDELNRHFLWTKRITPSRCRVTIAGIAFESDSLYGLNKPILVKWSCADLSEVYLYAEDGTALGTARPVEALNPLAKHFGTELDMRQVAEANKRQQALKRATLRLAGELDRAGLGAGQGARGIEAAPGLAELPWMQRATTPLAIATKADRALANSDPAPELDPAEAERLRELASRIEAESLASQASRAAYDPPAWFANPLDRYEFLFGAHVRDGLELTPADREFFDQYEASDEYREATGGRYAQLRELYAMQPGAASAR